MNSVGYPRSFLIETGRAAYYASPESRKRARRAEQALRDDAKHPERAFVFNAFLNLIHRGAAPTEANILAESKRIGEANEQHYRELQERREARQVQREAAA